MHVGALFRCAASQPQSPNAPIHQETPFPARNNLLPKAYRLTGVAKGGASAGFGESIALPHHGAHAQPQKVFGVGRQRGTARDDKVDGSTQLGCKAGGNTAQEQSPRISDKHAILPDVGEGKGGQAVVGGAWVPLMA